MIEVTLNEAELAVLYMVKKEDAHKGGFQSYFVKLQNRYERLGRFEIDDGDIKDIRERVNHCDGDGGFQGRLRKIFARSLGHIIPELLRKPDKDPGQGDLPI